MKRGGPLKRKTELRAKTRLASKQEPPAACSCGGGLPSDGDQVCTCGSSWTRGDDRKAKRATLARSSAPSRSGRLKPASANRAAENRERRKVLAAKAEVDPWCFARVENVCTRRAQDGHELVRRSQGSSITDPEAIRGVCRPCHRWIGDHPAEAVARGLARWGMRTNPGDESPAGAA